MNFYLAIKDKEKVHLEIQTSRKSVVGVIRSTFWDSNDKKIRHRNYGRIKGKTLAQLKNIQTAMANRTQTIAGLDSQNPAHILPCAPCFCAGLSSVAPRDSSVLSH